MKSSQALKMGKSAGVANILSLAELVQVGEAMVEVPTSICNKV